MLSENRAAADVGGAPKCPTEKFCEALGKEVKMNNIGAVGMGLIGSAPQKPFGHSASSTSSALSLARVLSTE